MCRLSEYICSSGKKTSVEALLYYLRLNNPDLRFELDTEKLVHIYGVTTMESLFKIRVGIDEVVIPRSFSYPEGWSFEPFFATIDGRKLAKFQLEK